MTGTVLRVVAVIALVIGIAAPMAHADRPFAVSGQITDNSGALGDRQGEVSAAIDQLYAAQRAKLYVAYVDDFSGVAPVEWADRTAQMSGFGRRDMLLAVATGARQYAVSVDPDFPLTDRQLDDVASTAIEPALRANDWAGAAIGAANGYDAALSGRPITAPKIQPGAAPSSSGGGGWLILLLVLVALGAVLFFVIRRRRTGSGSSQPGGRPQVPTAELETKAAQALVRTDDAVKTSRQEVGFAQAQFGKDAVEPFTSAVTFADEQLKAAFKLRQELDDDIPEDEPTRRRMLQEIISRCDKASEKLDEMAAEFDRLRDLEANAPEVLEGVKSHAEQTAGRLTQAQELLGRLSSAYPASALSDVAGNPAAATDRLEFAVDNAREAETALGAGDRSRAVPLIIASQSAVDQATQLVEALERRGKELDEAREGIEPLMREIDADLSTARSVSGDPRWSGKMAANVGEAERVIAQVRQDMTAGTFDPLAALRQLEAAGQNVSGALDEVRDEQEREEKARARLQQAMLTARSSVAAASDFITTHRGVVGSTARTRLSEAHGLLERAYGIVSTDPVSALAAAQQADALAQQASAQAQQDYDAESTSMPAMGGGGGGGGMGGLAAAMLGGILLGGGGGGGGFGGGGGGQGPVPTQRPGSFGGAATRGRRSVGGMF